MQKKRIIASLTAVVLLLAMLTVIPTTVSAAPSTKTYTPDFANHFWNPERGVHNRYELIQDPTWNKYIRPENQGIPGFIDDKDDYFVRSTSRDQTLVHSYIHLDDYKNMEVLPSGLLAAMEDGFARARVAGVKCVVRPAYTWDGSVGDVPTSRMIKHAHQLGEVWTRNADVIFALEAGYIGPWGEWHDDPRAEFSDGHRGFEDRNALVKAILTSTSTTDIPLAMRYPPYIMEILWPVSGWPNTSADMFTQAEKDRIGIVDDAYGSNGGGTYGGNVGFPVPEFPYHNGWIPDDTQKKWISDLRTSKGFNKYGGGESWAVTGRGAGILDHSHYLHTSELNEDWHSLSGSGEVPDLKATQVPADAKNPAESVWQRMRRLMGYRYRLIDATFDDAAKAGLPYNFSINIDNDGYAGILRQRPVFLVFDNGTIRRNVQLTNFEPRSWIGGESHNGPYSASQSIIVPTDLPSGSYTLALWLPDQATSMRSNPKYSVRFANLGGMWDSAKGYNKLGTVAITAGNPEIPDAPVIAQTGIGDKFVKLGWEAAAWATSYNVYQSTTSGGSYSLVASGITDTSYTVTGLTNNTTYYFVVRSVGDLGTSGNSNQVSGMPVSDTTPPTTPAGLKASNLDKTSLTLGWNASTHSTGIQSYEVYRNGVLIATVPGGGTLSIDDSGLQPNTEYTYTVKAKNNNGVYSELSDGFKVRTLKNLEIGFMIEDYTRSDSLTQNNTGGNSQYQNASSITGNVLQWNGAWSRLDFNSGQLTAAKYLVFRMKAGAGSNHLSEINIAVGGLSKTLGELTSDAINSGSFTDLVIDLTANGISSPTGWSSMEVTRWGGGDWNVFIDAIFLANDGGVVTNPTTVTTTTATTTTTTTTSTTTAPGTTTTVSSGGQPAYSVMRIDNLYAAVNGVKVRVNDNEPLAPIFNKDGRTMIPFRFIATCFDAEVDWDGDSGSVIIIYKGKEIKLPIGLPYAYVDGVQISISAPAQIMTEYNRTFVPFRVVAELFGDINLDYDPGTMTIIASDGDIATPYDVAYYVNKFNTICG